MSPPPRVRGRRLVDKALSAGINYIETANTYGNQARFDRTGLPGWRERRSAEEIVGDAIRGRRDEVVLATKVSEAIGDGPNDGGAVGGGLSRYHIMSQIERSWIVWGGSITWTSTMPTIQTRPLQSRRRCRLWLILSGRA